MTTKEDIATLQAQVRAQKEEIKWMKTNMKEYVEHTTMSDDTRKEMAALRAEMGTKVSYKQFYWVIGIMMSILMSVLSYIISQVHDVRSQQYEVAREVSEINGTLEHIEFININ